MPDAPGQSNPFAATPPAAPDAGSPLALPATPPGPGVPGPTAGPAVPMTLPAAASAPPAAVALPADSGGVEPTVPTAAGPMTLPTSDAAPADPATPAGPASPASPASPADGAGGEAAAAGEGFFMPEPTDQAAGRQTGRKQPRRKGRKQTRRGRGGRTAVPVKKDAFYVRVDGGETFESATRLIGQKMPFTKPRATSAMRVYANGVIVFSTMLISAAQRERVLAAPISVPVSPLTRLERRAGELADDLAADTVVVERLIPEEDRKAEPDAAAEQRWTFTVRTEDGTTYLDSDEPDRPFNLAKRKERISVFMRSGRTGRVMAIGFLGHLDKPGRAETPARAAAKILNIQSGVADFQLLSGISGVHVPPQPGSRVMAPTMEHQATFHVPVTVFAQDNSVAGTGAVKVTVDLRHTAAGGQSLQLADVTADKAIGGVFDDVADLFSQTMVQKLREELAEDLADVLYSVVLGEVDDRTVGVVLAAAERCMPHGVDLSPFGYRIRETPAA